MKKYSSLLLGLGILLFIGCSKDAMNDPNNESLSSQEVQAQMKVNETTEGLDEMLAQLLINNKSGSTNKTSSECVSITFTENNISVVYDQCVIDGKTLNGSIILTAMEGDEEGTTGRFAISFKAFTYNNYVLEGTKSMVFNFSEPRKPTITIDTDMAFVDQDEVVTTHKGSKIFTWHMDNFNTEEPDFTCVGAWDIMHKDITYQFEVTSPLGGKLNCPYIISGVVALEVHGLKASLDFGSGECDQAGTIIFPNGDTKDVSW